MKSAQIRSFFWSVFSTVWTDCGKTRAIKNISVFGHFSRSCCYLELLDKLQKRICRTAGPSLAASFEPYVHRRNVAGLSLFYRYYFGRCSPELAELVPYSRERSTRYSDRLHDFSVTIPRCYKDVHVNSFFPRTARLCNSLPIECFPLTYDLMALSLELTDTF